MIDTDLDFYGILHITFVRNICSLRHNKRILSMSMNNAFITFQTCWDYTNEASYIFKEMFILLFTYEMIHVSCNAAIVSSIIHENQTISNKQLTNFVYQCNFMTSVQGQTSLLTNSLFQCLWHLNCAFQQTLNLLAFSALLSSFFFS